MLLGLGPGDHFLEARTLIRFPAGDTGVRKDVFQKNIVGGGVVPQQAFLGMIVSIVFRKFNFYRSAAVS